MEKLLKLFGYDAKTMSVRKEIIGGITSFLTMAYILAVNPSIIGATGMDQGAVFTSTCIAAVVGTMVMALYAKLPFVLAPGMGLNAFFAFTVVLTMGYTWQFALTAVLIEGLIFILLTLTGLRQKMVEAIPTVLRSAISPGIGLFIALVGLKNAGVVVSSDATFVTIGNLKDPAVLLAIFGILFSAVLVVKKLTGALLFGIIATTLIGIPVGVTHCTAVVDFPPSIRPIVMSFEWGSILTVDMVVCVITFLFIDMFDTMGTLIGVASRAGMVDEKGNIPFLGKAFMADAVGTTVGACLGSSTITTFVESASGVEAGGRSGLTAATAALCFFLSLFFAPLFLCIPSQATAPALILVGVMMMGGIGKIDFTKYATAIPCFFCIALMPMTYSISDGILIGVISYVAIHLFTGKLKEEDPDNDVTMGTIVLAVLFVLKYALL